VSFDGGHLRASRSICFMACWRVSKAFFSRYWLSFLFSSSLSVRKRQLLICIHRNTYLKIYITICVLPNLYIKVDEYSFTMKNLISRKLKELQENKKGQMAGATAGMVIALIMVAIVLGVMITSLEDSINMSDEATEVFELVVTLGWVALTILAVGIIAFVGKWIIGIFQ